MMRPIGLYLAEFHPGGPVPLGLAASTAPVLLSDLSAESDCPAFEASCFDASPDFETGDLSSLDEVAEAAPLLLEAPSEPAPDVAALRAELEAAHEAALVAARARWADEEGAALAARIGEAFAGLETRLADALAPLLEPFLAHGARLKALAQLHTTLGTLLGSGETQAVSVSGPADLVAALRDSYGDRPGISFAEADTPDVTIALADTRIRSQLRGWARKLDSALGASA